MRVQQALGLALVAAAALAACGSGESDGPAPVPGTLNFSGTAAKGAALAGATVSLKCAAGTAANPVIVTTNGSGAYTAAIAGASLPCALKVVGTEGSTFHAVVPGTGTTGNFVANLTPLSEMIVARASGGSPAAYYAAFGSGNTLSAATLTTALAYVQSAMAPVTDLTDVNPLTDTLVVGNALDQKIDAVVAALTGAGLTLPQVVTAIVANPEAPKVVAAPIAPSASDCAWLKSGKYRMIAPSDPDPTWRVHVLQVDAAAMTVTDQDNVTTSITSDGDCQLSVDQGGGISKVMVSSGGMLVVHSQSKTLATDRLLTIGLPEQTLPVSEFAGTWNVASWDPYSGVASPGYVALSQEVTLDATGQITSSSQCSGLAACVAGTGPFPSFTTNAAAGGFDMIENGSSVARAFMFKTLSGKAAMVLLDNQGQFVIASRKEPLGALPAVGTVQNFRQVIWNGNGTTGALSEDTVTITAIDATARTTTRLLASNNRVDVLTYDKPRDGLRYRALNSCTTNGVASNCTEIVQVPLQGMGINLTMSVGVNPATAFYQASIGKPD